MPSTVLRVLPILSPLALKINIRYYYYSHFIDEETEAEKLSKFPKIVELASSRAMIQSQAVWGHTGHYFTICYFTFNIIF